MTKSQILTFINNADISQDDWHEGIQDMLPSDYAKGYYAAKLEALTNSLGSNEEDFRYELWELVSLIA